MKLGAGLLNLSIKNKLRTIVLVISGVSVLGACGVFLAYQWIISRSDLARQLEVMADVVGDQTTAAIEFDQPEQAEIIIGSLRAEMQIVGSAVYTGNGRLFARYLREGASPSAIPDRPPPDGRMHDGGHLLVFRPITSGGERIGTFCLRSDGAEAWKRLMVDLGTVALVLLGATAGILYLTARLGGVITAPVLRLAGVVQAVSRDRDYSVRVESRGRDEINRLIQGFNDMLSQIQARDTALARARDELEERVTERTRAIEDLNRQLEVRMAELAAANRELEGFSYSVSHDLRAPLRAIDGFSKILLEEKGASLDEEGRRVLGVVRKNTIKMGRLIDDLLEFSRMGRKGMQSASIDMTQLAKMTAAELLGATERSIEVSVADLPTAAGDVAMIRQVLTNLVSNAIKYSAPRETATIRISGRREGPENAYTVEDNGVGFDMRHAGKLFRVFERLHSAQEFEGTGVGLALVQRVVQRHGGRVWAEGRLNEGAAFHFTLPRGISEEQGGASMTPAEKETIHA